MPNKILIGTTKIIVDVLAFKKLTKITTFDFLIIIKRSIWDTLYSIMFYFLKCLFSINEYYK